METVKKKGFPLVGGVFLGMAIYEFLQGDDWVVWAILGVLFGGLGIFRNRKRGDV